MKVLYMAMSGASDPTRASVPLHMAANGSVEVGHEVTILLAGDATELLSEKTLNSVEGVGVPPARELMAKLKERGATVYI